ncbi:hypothetical protein DFS34DRAFT_628198 [Phlyctochytrium arcticum]|nr:hypothetical protein DFS34DRAFT_628198 [Phlyctochytrium arcticum]
MDQDEEPPIVPPQQQTQDREKSQQQRKPELRVFTSDEHQTSTQNAGDKLTLPADSAIDPYTPRTAQTFSLPFPQTPLSSVPRGDQYIYSNPAPNSLLTRLRSNNPPLVSSGKPSAYAQRTLHIPTRYDVATLANILDASPTLQKNSPFKYTATFYPPAIAESPLSARTPEEALEMVVAGLGAEEGCYFSLDIQTEGVIRCSEEGLWTVPFEQGVQTVLQSVLR